MGYKWSTRSVERLPPFRPQKLRNRVLVIGNTADPLTSIASARLVAELLGDQAALVEQLGFGHTTLAESSRCMEKIVADHVIRGIVSISRGDFLQRAHWIARIQLPQEKETKCEVDDSLGRLAALFFPKDEDPVPRFVVQRP